jgi:hypothetical protein
MWHGDGVMLVRWLLFFKPNLEVPHICAVSIKKKTEDA